MALRATVLRLAVSSSAPRKRGKRFGQHRAPCCSSSGHALPASGKLASKFKRSKFSNVPALQKAEYRASRFGGRLTHRSSRKPRQAVFSAQLKR